jgi:hypothetical protein
MYYFFRPQRYEFIAKKLKRNLRLAIPNSKVREMVSD